MANIKKEFSKIYDKHIEKIYRFVFFKVDSQETAEDLTSKVFLRGWEAYKNQNPKSKIQNPNAFLYQIARNIITDYYREKGRTQVIAAEYVPQMADPRTDLEERAIINSDLETAKQALQNLKGDYQEVITLHYLNDVSVPEIAKILDRPEGTIRVMIHRGLKDLKKEIVKEG